MIDVKSVALAILVLAAMLVAPFSVGTAQAKSGQTERQCLSACGTFPRYPGIETDAQYAARMRAQAAYDRCKMACGRKTSEKYAPSFVPIGEDAKAYFKRNGMRMP